IRQYLPSLFYDEGPYHGVRGDFYEVVSELIAERYFGAIQKWCQERGLSSSGHLLAEEKLVWHTMYYGDLMACLRKMDIPGMDMLTSDPRVIVVGQGFLVPKLISSAAHILGRYETMSETSDYAEQQAKRSLSPKAIRLTAFLLHMLGANIITSYYTHPYAFSDPETLRSYSDYCTFVGRLGVMLRNARHLCDVAVLYPIAGIWVNFYPTKLSMYDPHPNERVRAIDDGFVALCRWLLNHHVDFDIVDEKAVQEGKEDGGLLKIGEERYRVLLIPMTDALRPETLRKLDRLIKQGFNVILIGEPPKYPATLKTDPKSFARLSSSVFPKRRRVGQIGDDLLRWLQRLDCGIEMNPSISDVWVTHFKKRDKNVYPIANVSGEEHQVEVRLKGRGEFVEVWNPETGARTRALTIERGDSLWVRLTVQPWQGVLLVQGDR
ncbi:MAG: glycosyl hydrolase, partial [Armatimonadetes bacterium]|nr:glycosyl hydrolase [Armatimonadota bacterium]MDW8122463.1 glycosyl hydrolase [Armatimonadota bacterium]